MRLLATKTEITEAIDDEPLSVADAYERSKRPHGGIQDGAQVLWFFAGEYYWWTGLTYVTVTRKKIHSDIYRFLRGRKLRAPKLGVYKCRPELKTINKVMDALDSVCECPHDCIACWLDDAPTPVIPPANVLAFENGLLDVNAYLTDGNTTLHTSTPAWFSTEVFPHPFTPGATCPMWLAFLDEVLSKDSERIELLQEWFGYNMTRDTSQQKMMLMAGLPRSGKSTILDMLDRVVGPANVARPRMKTLTGQFGLHPLINKSVAILADAHISRDTDAVDVLELLKTITGEDRVDIHRKHLDAINNVRLPVRFTIAVNEIPDLPDASNAVIPRLLALRFTETFEGREDRTLGRRLASEAPGVILWALEGLARLRENGKFTEAKDSKALIDEISRTTSPVRAFLSDELIMPHQAKKENLDAENLFSPVQDVWERWQRWAKYNGHHAGTKIGLGKRLKAIVPNLEKPRLGPREERAHNYLGIALRHPSSIPSHESSNGNGHNARDSPEEELIRHLP